MTPEEWAALVAYLVNWCWPYATQNERQELLKIRAIVAVVLEGGQPPDPTG